jgi:hypothetical protein
VERANTAWPLSTTTARAIPIAGIAAGEMMGYHAE